ncbi:MAG: hypothetical protein ACP5N6_14670, partial [Anaerolineae bacterium]
ALPAARPLSGAAGFRVPAGKTSGGGKPSRRSFPPTTLYARALRPARASFRPQTGPPTARGDASVLCRPTVPSSAAATEGGEAAEGAVGCSERLGGMPILFICP